LRQLDIPTIIFTWRNDKTHPVSTAKILADRLPNVQSLVISDADDVQCWTTQACQFLDQLSRGKHRKTAA
jgi:pimeloyl-ACP methyl ester carboxylesterase